MSTTEDEKPSAAARLTVAISSRALFDLSASNEIYENEGLAAYRAYQIDQEEQVLEPGEAFPLVKKLLNFNNLLEYPCVDVILLSRNSADTGLRIFNSIEAHGLDIKRAAFSGGESPYRYVQAFGCDLFLSMNGDDVRHALDEGVAAATLLGRKNADSSASPELRIAFDGDAVLFSDEAERIYQERGLEAFGAEERAAAHRPLPGGPFKNFLAALQRLQTELPPKGSDGNGGNALRTALVTARSAPAHERVIRTLRDWDIRLDESLFLGGMNKGMFLQAFGADIFFDDQPGHIAAAREHVAAGHVPSGVANEP